MLVSRFQQANKKNFEKMDFWFQVYAHLIEILTQVKKFGVRCWETGETGSQPSLGQGV
jgi:hypothetical protein